MDVESFLEFGIFVIITSFLCKISSSFVQDCQEPCQCPVQLALF